MADAPEPKPRAGCFCRLIAFVMFLILATLGVLVYQIFQPQQLNDIEGYGATAAQIQQERDLSEILKLAVERGFPVTLTEGQLNRWLVQRLSARQGGLASTATTFKNVWVRLDEGRAEIITERSFFGRPLTLSIYLGVAELETTEGKKKEVQLHGGPYSADVPTILRGGRFGKLTVPQGFLILVLPEYKKLAETFATELDLAGNEMSRIEFKKHMVVLSPAPETDPGVNLPGSFH